MSSMRKMFAIVVLVSAAAGCHSKKPAPTPPVEKGPDTGATGGAAYGGQKTDAPAADKDAPKPDK